MYQSTFSPGSAVLLAGEAGADERLAATLLILGAGVVALTFVAMFVPKLRGVINARLIGKWHSVEWDLTFVALIFLGGLALIGFSVYLFGPSRVVADFAKDMRDLNRENAALKTELEDAQREVENEKRISITLNFTVPPDVNLNNFGDFKSLKCRYRLSSGEQVSVTAQSGTAFDDIECRIDNITREVVIERVNLEQEVQVNGQPSKYKMLGHRENVYPAKPHYRLCSPTESPCN